MPGLCNLRPCVWFLRSGPGVTGGGSCSDQRIIMKIRSGSSQRDRRVRFQTPNQRPGEGSTGRPASLSSVDGFKCCLAFTGGGEPERKRTLGGAGKTESETASGANKSHRRSWDATNETSNMWRGPAQVLPLTCRSAFQI